MPREFGTPGLILPNFLIVGAMKAGTSSLADIMARHQDIFLADDELHFFNREDRFAQGLGEYSKHFRHSSQAWRGEKTPVYSRIADMPFLPERIYRSLGKDLRLFWIFRDPVERAISHYRHMLVTQTNPDRPNIINSDGRIYRFAEVIDRELNFKSNPVIVSRGYYAEQIGEFRKFFPAENFFFCRFEQLSIEPQSLMDSVCDFLNIEKTLVGHSSEKNASRQRMKKSLSKKITERIQSKNIPNIQSIFYAAKGALQRREVEDRFFDIDDTLKAQLSEHYAPHQRALSSIIDPK